jgi:dihydroorotase
MPCAAGIMNSHVHVRDPGLTVKEDFHTASMAAAAGGVTTIMCQPTTVPPTTTEAAFQDRVALGECKSLVDFAIQAGVSIDSLSHVVPLAKRGAASLEVYLQDYPAELATRDAAALWRVLESVAESGCVAGVFRGDESLKNLFADRVKASGRVDLLAWSDSRPPILEAIGVAVTLSVAAEVGCPVHLRQISTKAAMDMILAMKALHPSLSISVEVTPHNPITTRGLSQTGGLREGHTSPARESRSAGAVASHR